MTTANPSADQVFQEINDYIRDAREMCGRGEYVELKGLDSRVAVICGHIEAMQKEDAQRYATNLQQMMQELTELQAMFVDIRDGLAQELTGTAKHHQAARAYKQAELPPVKPADPS